MAATRRSVLVGGAAGLTAVALGLGAVRARKPAPPAEQVSAERWMNLRRPPYFVGHRGAGGVVPEHTVEGYRFAIEQGLPAIEISVGISSDGVAYCLHDPTLDRTTTLSGPIASRSSQELDRGRVQVPFQGPAWSGDQMPRIPRLTEALEVAAGKAVLCIEAKSTAAFDPMLRLLEDHAVMGTAIIKCPVGSPAVAVAHRAGLPVYAYLGSGADVTNERLKQSGQELDRERDVLVIPTRDRGRYFADSLVARALEQGPPVWVYSAHRRSEVAHYAARGVEGFVVTTAGYTASDAPAASNDAWGTGRIRPGLMTRDPYSGSYAARWGSEGVLSVSPFGSSARLTLGDMCPVDRDSYTVRVEMMAPASRSTDGGFSLVFAAGDDASPDIGQPLTGYEALVGLDGSLALRRHDGGARRLATTLIERRAARVGRGEWETLSVSVDADTVSLSWRGESLTATDARWRGGYLHLGRVGQAGSLSFRGVRVSEG